MHIHCVVIEIYLRTYCRYASCCWLGLAPAASLARACPPARIPLIGPTYRNLKIYRYVYRYTLYRYMGLYRYRPALLVNRVMLTARSCMWSNMAQLFVDNVDHIWQNFGMLTKC
jgi:hypothetical protein